MATKSKILVVGGTGHVGNFMVEASVNAGHRTYVLVRDSTLSNPSKSQIIDHFKSLGVNLVSGDLNDRESLVKAIKQVDVVISTVGHANLADQHNLILAIKQAGNVKRFLPSEYGNDVERAEAVDIMKSMSETKTRIRRAVEAEGIPYTYVCAYLHDLYFLNCFLQPGLTSPPTDKLFIFGDGNLKGIFNNEKDIATYTIRAVDDPRTLNKVLYIKPAGNIYSFNDLVSLWEKKIGKSLKKTYISEEKLLKNIQEAGDELSKLLLSVNHSVFVKGAQNDMKIDPSIGVEASRLYPNVNYTSVDDYLNQFV